MASSGLTQVEREVRSIQGCLEKLAGKTAVLRAHLLAGEVVPAAMGRSVSLLAGLIIGDLAGVLTSPTAGAQAGLPQQVPLGADGGPGGRCAVAPIIEVHPVCPSEKHHWASACTTDAGPAHREDSPPASAAIPITDLWSGAQRGTDSVSTAPAPADGAGASCFAPAPDAPAHPSVPAPASAAHALAGTPTTIASPPTPTAPQEQDLGEPAPETAAADPQEHEMDPLLPSTTPAPQAALARAQAEELLRGGLFDTEVARQCKVSPRSVRRWRAELGLPPSDGRRGPSKAKPAARKGRR